MRNSYGISPKKNGHLTIKINISAWQFIAWLQDLLNFSFELLHVRDHGSFNDLRNKHVYKIRVTFRYLKYWLFKPTPVHGVFRYPGDTENELINIFSVIFL